MKNKISKDYLNIKNLDSIRKDNPWTYYVLDNFLSRKQLTKSQEFIQSFGYNFLVNKGDLQKINYSLNFDNSLNEIFLSLWFKNLLEKITQKKVYFNEKNFIQLRKMDSSSPRFPRHVDSFDDEKSLIVILYLSKDWTTERGGNLCLHKKINSSIKQAIKIEPLENRLIILPTDSQNWHSVEKVNNWDRYSIIHEWFIY